MPKPKTSPDLSPKPYRLLKSDIAAKLSARSQGGISYVLLATRATRPNCTSPSPRMSVVAASGQRRPYP